MLAEHDDVDAKLLLVYSNRVHAGYCTSPLVVESLPREITL
jgi:hypothetical protein